MGVIMLNRVKCGSEIQIWIKTDSHGVIEKKWVDIYLEQWTVLLLRASSHSFAL